MRKHALPLFALSLAFCIPLYAQITGVCPTSAVFLALENQVRGYPTRANGPTAPCQIIKGAQTTLGTANKYRSASTAFCTYRSS